MSIPFYSYSIPFYLTPIPTSFSMDYLASFKPIYAYITKPSDQKPIPPENPTFCATYNLEPEQLRELRSFYTVDI